MGPLERAEKWPEEWMREGHRKGVVEGQRKAEAEALARDRTLLARFASARFGDTVGKQIEAELKALEDPTVVHDIGELIVVSGGGAELVESVVARLRGSGG